MSGFNGMDVEAVRALSNTLKSSGSQITEMATKVTSQLGNTQWNGNDRQAFEGRWGSHQNTMRNISAALEQFATTAEKNAAEQEQVSQA